MRIFLILSGLVAYAAVICSVSAYAEEHWNYRCVRVDRPGKQVKYCPYPHP